MNSFVNSDDRVLLASLCIRIALLPIILANLGDCIWSVGNDLIFGINPWHVRCRVRQLVLEVLVIAQVALAGVNLGQSGLTTGRLAVCKVLVFVPEKDVRKVFGRQWILERSFILIIARRQLDSWLIAISGPVGFLRRANMWSLKTLLQPAFNYFWMSVDRVVVQLCLGFLCFERVNWKLFVLMAVAGVIG